MSRNVIIKSDTWINYLLGSDRVSVDVYIPHGRGKQQITIMIDPELIVKIGQALAGTRTSGERGHAIYHLEHPTVPYPCSGCGICAHTLRYKDNDKYCATCNEPVGEPLGGEVAEAQRKQVLGGVK